MQEMQGAMTVKTVPDLWEQRSRLFVQDAVSLSKVSAIDSAGIAFLVQWAKARPGRRLVLQGTPESALRLIETFKLQELFALQ